MSAGTIASPCTKVCLLAPDGTVCTGCRRTPSEIMAWSSMTHSERSEIMERCLASMWGTKCRECMGHAKQQQIAEIERDIDNLGEALL
jgi:predicted Fe-S protein YdhL (DUF1289 family)